MSILITICARGGSKGIPGKNIKDLAGKPLIVHTIDVAKKFSAAQDAVISLSTDSDEIMTVARAAGIETDYKRPENLATDTAGKMGAIVDLLDFEEKKRGSTFKYVLDLDVTSPLRTVQDLTAALEMLESADKALNIFSVNPANRNPYFNMVEQNEEGYFQLCKSGNFVSRQAVPKVYDMNASFYIYKRDFFLKGFATAVTPRSLVYVMPHICFDLDHPIDFEFLQFLIENKKIDDLI